MHKQIGIAGLALVIITLITASFQRSGSAISFNQEVRPILNRHCLSCHGGVKQNGGFSLLFEEDAFQATESGQPAIVRGDADASEMIRRLSHPDPELRMPYEAPPLSEAEQEILTQWVEEGAKWEDHWAYQPIQPVSLPKVSNQQWPQQRIDRFVLAQLEANNRFPSPAMQKANWLRRVSLDLIGLPLPLEMAQAFLEDSSSRARERMVDTLLSLPQFGEKWATTWLDYARYADSKGYEKDLNRQIWPYRDWVIRALNNDMPFDQFTVEQLAGDLLPQPSEDQVIATAFHRNSMANDEGGTDDEEFRTASQIERVGTTWEVWMGTTMACVQCHSHPYDPIRQEDFYSFMAYFNNTADADLYNEQPKLYQYPDTIKSSVRELMSWLGKQAPTPLSLPDTFLHAQQQSLLYQLGFRRIEAEEYQDHSPLIENSVPLQEAVAQIQDSSWVMYRKIDLTEITAIDFQYSSTSAGGFLAVHIDSIYGRKLGEIEIPAKGTWREQFVQRMSIDSCSGLHDVYLVFRINQVPSNELFRLHWLQFIPEQILDVALTDSLEKLYQLPALGTPIFQELQGDDRRTTYLFDRGNWLQPSQEVQPALPQKLARYLPHVPEERLSLAKWTVDPRNPLTARVIVNRFWEQIFGRGLVPTLEDFGTMGAPPSHPQLLDDLAYRFQTEMAWSIKSLLREWVLSATYNQASQVDSTTLAQDPLNVDLGRSTRLRLNAEQIRDQALAVSGLLDSTMFGPPVRVEAPVPNDAYRQGNLIAFNPYRRSVYTFWKRTYPVPFMITFDGPQRNICTSRRINTNTPLQALSLLNDSLYYRAAEHLAMRVAEQVPLPEEQISLAYEHLLYRPPAPAQLAALTTLYQTALESYATEPDPVLAALTLTCNALLNLDAVISK